MISYRRGVRVIMAIAVATAGATLLVYLHCIRCRALPNASRPIFGDYTIHSVWNGTVDALRVVNLQTQTEPSLDPISRLALRRLAQRAATEALSPAGKRFVKAEIDARVYGEFFPCEIEIRAVESTPRVGVHPPRVIGLLSW